MDPITARIKELSTTALVVMVFIAIGIVSGYSLRSADKAEDLAPKLEALTAAVDALSAKMDKIQAERCMNVTTKALHVSVYDTPNLGIVKVK